MSDSEIVAKLLSQHFDEVGSFFSAMLHLCDHFLFLSDYLPKVVLASTLFLKLHQADLALTAELCVQLQVPALPN